MGQVRTNVRTDIQKVQHNCQSYTSCMDAVYILRPHMNDCIVSVL